MSGREVPKQLPPSISKDFAQFPRVDLKSRDVVYRAFADFRQPGWYSSDGSGRFDLSAPRGTLYVADTVKAAVRERLSGMFDAENRVAFTLVNDMAVADLSITATGCADLGAEDLDQFGVTRELDTMVPYGIPRQWAHRFASAKMGGIHYGTRSTRGAMNAWAVFGNAGQSMVKERGGRLDYITACDKAGLTILGKPISMVGAAVATPPTP